MKIFVFCFLLVLTAFAQDDNSPVTPIVSGTITYPGITPIDLDIATARAKFISANGGRDIDPRSYYGTQLMALISKIEIEGYTPQNKAAYIALYTQALKSLPLNH